MLKTWEKSPGEEGTVVCMCIWSKPSANIIRTAQGNTQSLCFGSGLFLMPATDCHTHSAWMQPAIHSRQTQWRQAHSPIWREPSVNILKGGAKAMECALWHHCVSLGARSPGQPAVGLPEGGCLSPGHDGVFGDHAGCQLLWHAEELPVPGPSPHQHHQGHLPVLLPTRMPLPQFLEAQSASQSGLSPSQLCWAVQSHWAATHCSAHLAFCPPFPLQHSRLAPSKHGSAKRLWSLQVLGWKAEHWFLATDAR